MRFVDTRLCIYVYSNMHKRVSINLFLTYEDIPKDLHEDASQYLW